MRLTFDDLTVLMSLTIMGRRELFSLFAVFLISKVGVTECAWKGWHQTTWQWPRDEFNASFNHTFYFISESQKGWVRAGLAGLIHGLVVSVLTIVRFPSILVCRYFSSLQLSESFSGRWSHMLHVCYYLFAVSIAYINFSPAAECENFFLIFQDFF